MHETAIANGVLRYCPVCDGFEHKGARIAVLGCDISGAAEAIFLSAYSDDVTLLPRREVELTREEQRDLGQAGIKVVSEALSRFEPTKCEMRLHFEDQPEPLAFDVLYPALGCRPRSGLARQLGLAIEESGKVAATAPLDTEIPGLFCAGDVVDGLDQISVAMGHGAIAATKAHNWLRASDGDTVEAVLDLDGGNTAHG
ncbi:thioredoxin reductase (NADPH) [Novosphingobium subterraneum]|uniref:Thioredoxin reductase n=1 Tax=Novosphingobium subterraneum TaxID=48936 RepID=A0A0B8Z900_9SPHN|nr:thioredoxin reductase (NADPH) [Novosphingobium subterraneum]